MPSPRRILIAHQGTIPHYRVRFYEVLEERRPRDWAFDVVYDTRSGAGEASGHTGTREHRAFGFPILDCPTSSATIAGHRLLWQHCFLRARSYDAIVTDTHLVNLTYPALSLHRLAGRKFILWGHPRDMNTPATGPAKRTTEALKRWWMMRADHFLAYTDAGRAEMLAAGYPEGRITVVNNTIDTVAERALHLAAAPRRDALRTEMGFAGCRIILFVGRLRADKRIAATLDVFEALHQSDPEFRLLVVGDGEDACLVEARTRRIGGNAVVALGAITDPALLAPVFAASDLYMITGSVGVGPLQAMCHDLPVLALDLPTHGPEFAYLSPKNSAVLPGDLPAAAVAERIPAVFDSFAAPGARDAIYSSIAHLTIEDMAERFMGGINDALGVAREARA
jgi:L-malate glycosyltransferase